VNYLPELACNLDPPDPLLSEHLGLQV
jgi:hypothetical protein